MMSPILCFVIAAIFFFAGIGYIAIKDLGPFFAMLLAIIVAIPLLAGLHQYMEHDKAAFLHEVEQIAAAPKKWISKEILDTKNISLYGATLLVEKKIDELKSVASASHDKKKVMLIGAAIGALEEQSECLRQMKSPAKCFN